MASQGGVKNDQEKPRMSLLPFVALKEVAKILTFGAEKYAPHNWLLGMDWSRIESAMLRHYTAYTSGEDIDPESGILHMAHLATNALFLLTYQLMNIGNDDRFKQEKKPIEKRERHFEGFLKSPFEKQEKK